MDAVDLGGIEVLRDLKELCLVRNTGGGAILLTSKAER